MILDYLWRYPPYIILLIMVDSVCLLSPGVSYALDKWETAESVRQEGEEHNAEK